MQRLARAESEGTARRAVADAALAVGSVVEHLRALFNVRQGSVATLPDYGMPDFQALVGADIVVHEAIRRTIVDQIRRYEPRLIDVRVRYVQAEDDELDLRFHISARLELADNRSAVSFETVVGDHGVVHVRP